MRKVKVGKIHIVFNFFSDQELEFFKDITSRCDYIVGDGSTGNDALDWSTALRNESLKESINRAQDILEEKNNLLKSILEKDFKCSLNKEHLSTITRCSTGWGIPRHVDNQNENGFNVVTPAGYPSRDISNVIYLNEDFSGGQLIFPELDVTIDPVAGSLVYFPGDYDHVHMVSTVTSGLRMTLTGFWNIIESF